MDFDNIPKRELMQLPIAPHRLRAPSSSEMAQELKVLGVNWYVGDYTIEDYVYYDCLKRNGYMANLSNMIGLHNYILENYG